MGIVLSGPELWSCQNELFNWKPKMTSALPPPKKRRRKKFLRASWLRQATTTATSTRTVKINRLRLGKQPLCTCITLLYISSPSLHVYDVKLPNFIFCWGREHKTTNFFFFFFWTSIQSFRIKLERKLPTYDELNEMQWARKILNQRDRLHFLTDVFLAVAVVLD